MISSLDSRDFFLRIQKTVLENTKLTFIKQSRKKERKKEMAASPILVQHSGITCDLCRVSPIFGIRYKCAICPNFDMCEKCEALDLHDADHPLLKLRNHQHVDVEVRADLPAKKEDFEKKNSEVENKEEDMIERKWRERCLNSVGVCALCNVCGGSSASFCSCAKARFFESERKK